MTFITATAERVIQQAGVEPGRWKDIFREIGRFPYTVREQLLEAANTFSRCEIPDSERRVISEALSKQISQHRYSSDADWSLPSEMLDALEPILERLKPQSCVLRNAWLFEQWPDRFFERGSDHEDNEVALDETRQNAIREILDSEGFDGIESLVEHADSPYAVGFALAKTTGDQFLRRLIPGRLGDDQRDLEFACGFISNRYWPADWKWIDDALVLCNTDNTRAHLLEALRFSPDVWDRAAYAGGTVADLYWDRCRAFNPQLKSADVTTAVQNLCRHGRPAAAIDLLSMAIHQKLDLDADTLLFPLETLLALPSERGESQPHRMDRHHIRQIIGALQDRDDVDEVAIDSDRMALYATSRQTLGTRTANTSKASVVITRILQRSVEPLLSVK